MIRLFVALDIPEDIRYFITAERKQICDIDLRWEPVSKLHLTLKFIGSFPEKQLNKLETDLLFTESYSAIELSIIQYGFFFPRIFWLGLSNNNKLINLVKDLNKHLTKFGIPVEEKLFKPHLTLLRIPKDRSEEILNAFRGVKILNKSFICDNVTLYKSELSPKGSKYTPLKTYKLKDR